jgi:phosphoglycolate phosphatase
MSGQIKLVLIDLDGTLLDTAGEIAASANQMLAQLGRAPLPLAQVVSFVGKGAGVLVQKTLAASDAVEKNLAPLAQDQSKGASELFMKAYAKLNGTMAVPYQGVMQGLEQLRALDLKMACVTNKPSKLAVQLLQQTGMAAFFQYTLGGDQMLRKKPDAWPLVHTCEHFGLRVDQAMMVGDSQNDALSARAAGMKVLLVPYGYTEGENIDAFDCDGIVQTLAQVSAHL